MKGMDPVYYWGSHGDGYPTFHRFRLVMGSSVKDAPPPEKDPPDCIQNVLPELLAALVRLATESPAGVAPYEPTVLLEGWEDDDDYSPTCSTRIAVWTVQRGWVELPDGDKITTEHLMWCDD